MLNKRMLPLVIMSFAFLSPLKTGGPRFIPIFETLVVRAQKSAPPFIAFDIINRNNKNEISTEWTQLEAKPAVQITAGEAITQTQLSKKPVPQKLVLQEMKIEKRPEVVYQAPPQPIDIESFSQDLNPQQKRLLAQAQQKSRVLDQDWSGESNDDNESEISMAIRQAQQNSSREQTKSKVMVSIANALIEKAKPSNAAQSSESDQEPVVAGQKQQNLNDAKALAANKANTQDQSNQKTSFTKKISGPIEISGGLAITNDHYIDIRRNDEGITREVGRVDLRSGTYSIEVEDLSGVIVAKLVDKAGQTLGTGQVRVNMASNSALSLASKTLKIQPVQNQSVAAYSYYKPNQPPADTVTATFMRGEEEKTISPRSVGTTQTQLAKGSTTIARFASKHYMQTTLLHTVSDSSAVPLFPESMIVAFKSILDEKPYSSKELENERLAWGKVTLDQVPVSGIQVHLEGHDDVRPIYFNQFLIPDPKLEATTENGLFAFVDLEEGFHSLVAMRGDSIFSYQNIYVEAGSVAVANMENSIKTNAVPVKVFDAFNGTGASAQVTIQSLASEMHFATGSEVVTLPIVNRMGLIRVVPEDNNYLSANYQYNDSDSYVHLPLISWSWLMSIKNNKRISDQANIGVIVGFVHDEDFEVYLAGYDQFPAENIIYFDVQGHVIEKAQHGQMGGGFIVFNAPVDTHEVTVYGLSSKNVYSKVTQVDANTLSVLNFHE